MFPFTSAPFWFLLLFWSSYLLLFVLPFILSRLHSRSVHALLLTAPSHSFLCIFSYIMSERRLLPLLLLASRFRKRRLRVTIHRAENLLNMDGLRDASLGTSQVAAKSFWDVSGASVKFSLPFIYSCVIFATITNSGLTRQLCTLPTNFQSWEMCGGGVYGFTDICVKLSHE